MPCRLRWVPLSIVLSVLSIGDALLFGQTDVLTYHNDNMRTGLNLSEKLLTPQTVRSATFGKLFTLPVDGKVDAQPLLVSALTVPGKGRHNIVFVATEHGSLFAFDADMGTLYWHASLIRPGETTSDDRGCSQVVPEIGITGTPVIDLAAGPNGTIYAVAMSKDSTGAYHQRIHALNIATGVEQFGGPIDVQATYPGTGDNSGNGNVAFDPKQYKSRPGLLLVKGVVYTGWGSHCDNRPYTGWVIGYNETTLAQTSVFNFAPNGEGSAVWGAGGGMAADANGVLFFQLANGKFDGTLNATGFPVNSDYGNAFVKLSLAAGAPAVADYWTMFNTVAESNADEDLGSGGVLLIPDVVDSSGKTRHLGTGVGKDGDIYVFDRDNMGKFNPSNNGNLYQELASGLGGSEFASPAWFNGTVYFGAVGDVIRSFKMTAAKFGPSPSSTSENSFAFPGTTLSISANGTSNGILWAVENSSPAVLHAYDPDDLATEFYNSNQAPSNRDRFGNGNKFITPTIANGKVYVGTPNSVAVFGLLAPKLTSISPASGVPGSVVNVTLAGASLSAGPSVGVSGSGITVNKVAIISATEITAELTIAAGARAGAYNVTVTTPGGASNAETFTVTGVATLSGFSCLGSGQSKMPSLSSANCKVTLSAPAAAPQTVTLASSSADVTLPASVSVAAGATSATFMITAGRIPEGENVTLTATSGVSKTFSFFLFDALSSLTCNSTKAAPGGTLACTITFVQAEQSPSVAALSSSSSAIMVPASVAAAPNAASAAFNATIAPGATPQQATITALRDGLTVTFMITIGSGQ